MIGALATHDMVSTADLTRTGRSAARPFGGAGRRPAGAASRHHRRFARPLRSSCRLADGGGGLERRWSSRVAGVAARSAPTSSSPARSRRQWAPDEMLVEVRVPRRPGVGWGYEKFTRRANDWAIVGVATVAGRIVLANMGGRPLRAVAAEQRSGRRCDSRAGRSAGRRRHRAGRGHARGRRLPPASGPRLTARALRAPPGAVADDRRRMSSRLAWRFASSPPELGAPAPLISRSVSATAGSIPYWPYP